MSDVEPLKPQTPRRGFMYQTTTGILAAIVGLGPLAVGLTAFFAPLGRRKASAGNYLRVANLDSLPADGKPHRFIVVGDRNDAWSYYPPEPIGAVYLRRDSEEATPVAFTTVCPHLGCSVDWQDAADQFFCPCHQGAFEVDGTRTDPARSPSPRGLDSLDVEIRDGVVWVDFRKFKGGVSDKVEA
jgi:menaquinol-cytochrome c reductase iron-sulfur subunit